MNTREFLIANWEHEQPAFVECIKAVPLTGSAYTPNPKTRTAKEIVEHIIGHPLDIIEAIESGVIHHRNSTPVDNFISAADEYDAASKKALKLIAATDDNTWNTKKIPFFFFGQEIKDMEMPLRDISWQLFRDMIHHRGQLSVYYRPMGVRNPVIYGLTAEVMEEMMAGKSH